MDWLVVLAPLLLLPIVFLFVFVGCGLEDHGELCGDGGWEQSVTLNCEGLPANVKSLLFRCRLFDKTEGDFVELTKSNTPDFTQLKSVPAKLHVTKEDVTNGTFHCVASCDLRDENDNSLMAPGSDVSAKVFPAGLTDWPFHLGPAFPVAGQPQKFALSSL